MDPKERGEKNLVIIVPTNTFKKEEKKSFPITNSQQTVPESF